MTRYIDADDFKREMEKYLPDDRELALKVLKNIKTADVAEVVRCKECKYHDDIDTYGTVYCPNVIGGWVSERFFCAGGERREDVHTN